MEQKSNASGRAVKAAPSLASSSKGKAKAAAFTDVEPQDSEMADGARTPSTLDGDPDQDARASQGDPIDVDEQEDDQPEASGSTKLPKVSASSPEANAASTLESDEGEDDEPSDPNLLASYPIYLNTSLPSTSSLHLLQYPTFPRRSGLPLPRSAAEKGVKRAIRWRPESGWVHVEVPLDNRSRVYDRERAEEMGKGAGKAGGEIGSRDSRKKNESDSEDEWGGSSSKKRRDERSGGSRKGKEKMRERENKMLEKMRLEGDVMPNLTTYCVGVIKDSECHRWSTKATAIC